MIKNLVMLQRGRERQVDQRGVESEKLGLFQRNVGESIHQRREEGMGGGGGLTAQVLCMCCSRGRNLLLRLSVL